MQIAGVKPFSPLELPNLDAWLRAETVAGNDGDAIQTWTDESPAGHNASQATAGERPLLKRNILNGLSVMRYDGVDDSHSFVVTASATRTLFFVAKKRTAPTTPGSALFCLSDTSTMDFFTNNTSASSQYAWFSNQAAGTSLLGGVPDNWNIICVQFASDSSEKVWMGGGVGVVLDPSGTPSTSALIRLARMNTTLNGDYDIAEVLATTDVKSLTDLDRIGGYLSKTYNLAWALSS